MPPQTPQPAPKPRPKPAPARPDNPPVRLDRYAELGDPVYWYPSADPGAAPLVGVVTGIGVRTIDCNVFTAALHNTIPQEAAYHMDDPDARTERNSGGGWRHQPLVLATRKFLFALGVLRWNGTDRYETDPAFDFAEFAARFVGPAEAAVEKLKAELAAAPPAKPQ